MSFSKFTVETNVPAHNWQPLLRRRKSAFESDKLYLNISLKSITKSKSPNAKAPHLVKNQHIFILYFGEDVASVLNLKAKDPVEIFSDRDNGNYLRVKKIDVMHLGAKHVIYQSVPTATLNLRFVVPDVIRIAPLPSTPIEFKIYADGSLVIDISPFVVKEQRL